MQFDARNLGILLGAIMIVGALSAPWYVVDIGAARDSIGAATSQLPGTLGQFARELVGALPDRITVDAWDAFDRNDIVLLVIALAAAFAALIDRHDVATFIGAAAAGLIVIAMLTRPHGMPKEFISLSWGPWLALGGALVIVAASRMGGSEPEPTPAIDWTKPLPEPVHDTWGAPVATTTPADLALGDPAGSVAPPARS